MSKVLITESYLEDIADSIRAKNGTDTTYKPSEMAGAIDAISGGSANLEEKTVSPSETPIVVRPSTGYDGMSRVNVNAISDEYVGSMVPRITSLTITDGNVTAPSGYYPNEISDSVVSGTKQISITQNGTTTENVAIYANAEISVNVAGGGGGSGSNIPLLGTVTVTSDTRAFDIDLTDYQSYNFFFVVADVTLSASDWLYYVKNGSSASGGTYDNSLTTHNFIIGAQLNPLAGGNGIASGTVGNSRLLLENGAMTNLYVYAYASNKTIKAGSTFNIYGGNYANL